MHRIWQTGLSSLHCLTHRIWQAGLGTLHCLTHRIWQAGLGTLHCLTHRIWQAGLSSLHCLTHRIWQAGLGSLHCLMHKIWQAGLGTLHCLTHRIWQAAWVGYPWFYPMHPYAWVGYPALAVFHPHRIWQAGCTVSHTEFNKPGWVPYTVSHTGLDRLHGLGILGFILCIGYPALAVFLLHRIWQAGLGTLHCLTHRIEQAAWVGHPTLAISAPA